MKLKPIHLMMVGAICVTASAFVADNIKPLPKKKFIDPDNMDLSVKPGDDFFEYANGAWVKKNPIPAKQTRWGAFNILAQENTDRLVAILKKPAKPRASQKAVLNNV